MRFEHNLGIYGLENEYGFNAVLGSRPVDDDMLKLFAVELFGGGGDEPCCWLENAGKAYLDCGCHPEYAGPECASPGEAVVHDRAGERYMSGMVRALKSRYPAYEFNLIKNNTAGNRDFVLDSSKRDPKQWRIQSRQFTTFGTHENYLLSRDTSIEEVNQALLGFFVSRQLVAGAGLVVADGESYRIRVSQRSHFLEAEESLDTTGIGRRGIINTRDEALSNPFLFRRYHLIVGDANILYLPAFLKLATTAILLEMAGRGLLYGVYLRHPLKALEAISDDPFARVERHIGGTVSGVEIQRFYLDQAEEFVQKHDLANWKTTINHWRRIVVLLEQGNLAKLVGLTDWATKRRLIERRAERQGEPLTAEQASAWDLSYHDLLGPSNLVDKVRAAYDPPGLDLQVSLAMTTPPQTRAAVRAYFLERARQTGYRLLVEWDEMGVKLSSVTKDGELKAETLHFNDPHDVDLSRVDYFFDEKLRNLRQRFLIARG